MLVIRICLNCSEQGYILQVWLSRYRQLQRTKKWASLTYIQASHTTHVVCVNFIHEWRYVQFKGQTILILRLIMRSSKIGRKTFLIKLFTVSNPVRSRREFAFSFVEYTISNIFCVALIKGPPNTFFFGKCFKIKQLNIFSNFFFYLKVQSFRLIMENNFIQIAALAGHAVDYTIGPIFKHIIDCVQLYFTKGFANIVL